MRMRQTLRNEDAGSLQQDSEPGQSPTGFAFRGLRLECGRLLMPRALQLNSLPSAQRGGQYAATPVRRPVTGLSPRGGQDAGTQSGSQHTGFLAGMIGVQSFESGLPEALLPANDGGRRGPELSLDGVEGRAFGQHQNQLGAKHVSGWQSTGLGDAA